MTLPKEIPLPQWEGAFEALALALFREIWNDPAAQLHGRRGQKQAGVDLYGEDRCHGTGLVGVQCKLHGSGTDIRDGVLLKELLAEVEKARHFDPPLNHFIFATTARRSETLQHMARTISVEHKKQGLFTVEVMGWQDFEERLRLHEKICLWYLAEWAVPSTAGKMPTLRIRYNSAVSTTTADRPTVFVSYSHKDEVWKDRLVTHLKALELQGDLAVWDDRRIAAGDDWFPEIEEAMNRAAVAVLLVSPEFLASGFIRGTEVPHLLKRRQEGGLHVIPLFVRPSPWKAVDWLTAIQGRPKDAKPLAKMSRASADESLADLALEIRGLLNPCPPLSSPTLALAGPTLSTADQLLQQLKQLPAAQFEELVFRYDLESSVPGRVEAQAVRAIELLKVVRTTHEGIAVLSAELQRLKKSGGRR